MKTDDKKKEQKLCLVLTGERCGYDETISIDVFVHRLSEDEDAKRYPFISCDEHAPRLYRDLGSRTWFKRGGTPYGFSGLEVRDLYSADVDELKRRIAAIEHTHKALAKIRETAGYSDKFEDFVVRLASALKSDDIFIANELRVLVSNHTGRQYPEFADRKGFVRYSRREAEGTIRSMVADLTEEIKQAAE